MGSVHTHSAVLCGNGDLRIVNGPSELEGRLEICWNETWGTICDGGWSTFDANVACRQLGYAPSGKLQISILHFIVYNYIILV